MEFLQLSETTRAREIDPCSIFFCFPVKPKFFHSHPCMHCLHIIPTPLPATLFFLLSHLFPYPLPLNSSVHPLSLCHRHTYTRLQEKKHWGTVLFLIWFGLFWLHCLVLCCQEPRTCTWLLSMASRVVWTVCLPLVLVTCLWPLSRRASLSSARRVCFEHV